MEENITTTDVRTMTKVIASYKKEKGEFPTTLAFFVDGEALTYRLEVKQPKPFLETMEIIRAWHEQDKGYYYRPKHERKPNIWERILKLRNKGVR